MDTLSWIDLLGVFLFLLFQYLIIPEVLEMILDYLYKVKKLNLEKR